MITVELVGGLGNQLFGYSVGRVLEANGPVNFSTERLDKDKGRTYLLDQLGLELPLIPVSPQPIIQEKSMHFDPEILKVKEGTLRGYWQSWKYIPNNIRDGMFSKKFHINDKTGELANQIVAMSNSTFLHIRRSDNLRPSSTLYHGLLNGEYYKAAIDYIRQRIPDAHFFVFSDDPEWIKMNMVDKDMTCVTHNPMSATIGPDGDVVKNGHGREVEDLWLMSLCHNGIVANSTFSYWGTMLGSTDSDRTIIYPSKWFTNSTYIGDLFPSSWIKL